MSAKMIRRLMIGFISGAAIGVPASYFFQAGILREQAGLVAYLVGFPMVWTDPTFGMGQTARITVLLGGAVGTILAGLKKGKASEPVPKA
jgi:hypothetical protein